MKNIKFIVVLIVCIFMFMEISAQPKRVQAKSTSISNSNTTVNVVCSNDEAKYSNIQPVGIEYVKAGKLNLFMVRGNMSIKEIADSISMPVKKLKFMLKDKLAAYGEVNSEFAGLKSQSRRWDSILIADLNIEPKLIADNFEEFYANRLSFGGSITLVGLVIVFLSLLLISLLIAQFQHLAKVTKKKEKANTAKSVSTPVGTVTGAPEQLNANSVIAVIAAVHKYRSSLKQRKRILMTFNRHKVNMWNSSGKVKMPNTEFDKLRK